MLASQKRKKSSRSPSPKPGDKQRKVDGQDTDMTVLEDQDENVLTPTISLGNQSPTVSEQSDTTTINKRDILVLPQTVKRSPSQADAPTLTSLLMRSDPLTKLIDGGGTWPKIAAGLKKFFLPKQRNREQEVGKFEAADYVANLCTAYYSNENLGARIKKLDQGLELDKQTELVQVSDVVTFLENFMNANGQWDYIRNQDWFQDGNFVIAIDLNYYPDRSGYKDTPLFHKDTGGNNIFVNLVFDNEQPIESTEWFEDVAPPSTDRAVWQEALLPGSHLDQLDEARKALAAKLKSEEEQTGPKPVSGGVSEGNYIFVSWLDDLAWHATPTDTARLELTNDLARSLYRSLDKASEAEEPAGFGYENKQLNRNIRGIEILGTMAEVEGTRLREWLKGEGLEPQDINSEVAQLAWQALYSSALADNAGRTQYAKDVAVRAGTPWRITGEVSIANAEDSNLEDQNSVQIDETPIGLSTRRRANSLPENQQKIKDVRHANENTPRAFIRTWVRILNKESKEAKEGLSGSSTEVK